MTADEQLPPIEHRPPYSPGFVAHLHGGCYPDSVTPQLLDAVKHDHAGGQMLASLVLVQMELALAGDTTAS